MANFELIRSVCFERNMTIQELSQKIGRDTSSVHRLIREGSTNTTTIEAIAKVLNVPVSIFFEGHNDEVSKIQTELDHAKELLKEKERTINILLSQLSTTKTPVSGTK